MLLNLKIHSELPSFKGRFLRSQNPVKLPVLRAIQQGEIPVPRSCLEYHWVPPEVLFTVSSISRRLTCGFGNQVGLGSNPACD